jgi:rhodanese-related sulfurtransferase
MSRSRVTSGLPPVLQPGEVAELQGSDRLKILDVRSPIEFEAAHIAGSFNVPLDQLPEYRAELREVDSPLVLVCRSGTRAREAELLLREAGLEQVRVLEGGLLAWESSGLELMRGRQRWSLERQVRAIAGGLVLLGTLGSLLVWPPLIYLAVFVGGGLVFAGVTDFCMMARLLSRLPYNRGATSDAAEVIARLRETPAAPDTVS